MGTTTIQTTTATIPAQGTLQIIYTKLHVPLSAGPGKGAVVRITVKASGVSDPSTPPIQSTSANQFNLFIAEWFFDPLTSPIRPLQCPVTTCQDIYQTRYAICQKHYGVGQPVVDCPDVECNSMDRPQALTHESICPTTLTCQNGSYCDPLDTTKCACESNWFGAACDTYIVPFEFTQFTLTATFLQTDFTGDNMIEIGGSITAGGLYKGPAGVVT